MKNSTLVLSVLAILVLGFFLFSALWQEKNPTEEAQVEETTAVENGVQLDTNDAMEENGEADFGSDTQMEYPIPDNPEELGIESAPVEVLEEVYDTQNTETVQTDFILEGKNFAFLKDGQEAPELRVKLGDRVSVTLKSIEGFHDFVIDELGVSSEKISLGESTTVTFTASQAGRFEYYCSVGSHRAQGMFGTFIVES